MAQEPPPVCPACRSVNRAGARFCGSCGIEMPPPKICPGCGKPNSPAARFCVGCASSLITPVDIGASAPAVERAEAFETPQVGAQGVFDAVKNFARGNPYIAMGAGIAAGLVLIAILGVVLTHAAHKDVPVAAASGRTAAGTASGTKYATRLTHVRNGPTSIGTTILGD